MGDDVMGDEGRLFCRRGAGGMLPVHMACLSGYSDCVENIIPRGVWWGQFKRPMKEYVIYITSLSSPLHPSPLLPGHRLTSEVDSEDRTCLHAAACGGPFITSFQSVQVCESAGV